MNTTDRRLGRFVIPMSFVNSDPASVREALRGVIVVDAHYRIVYDDIEYVGICDNFEQVPLGNAVSSYKAVMQREADGATKLLRWDLGVHWDIYLGRQKVG
jgi:hypothetical protein